MSLYFNLLCLLVPGLWHTDADGEKEIHHKSWGIHLRHPQLIPGHCLHLLFLSPVVWNSWTAVNVLSNWSSNDSSFVSLIWVIMSFQHDIDLQCNVLCLSSPQLLRCAMHLSCLSYTLLMYTGKTLTTFS